MTIKNLYTQNGGQLQCITMGAGGGKPRQYKIYPNVIMVMRHTERLDEFFPDWISKNVNHPYKPYDLNMPMALPVQRPPQAYQGDPPITNTGDILARLIARGMYSTAYVPDLIYCSPSLRCIQTAYAVKQVTKCKAPIRVEPGLFESFNNYPMGLPEFATPQQRAQFNVDENYTPHTKLEDIVGHAQTVDIAAGTFAKKQRHSTEVDLCWDQVKIPYGALLVLERIEAAQKLRIFIRHLNV
ncbi:phosphoglycerate mutase family protein [Teladorsagia circumcincta]|uniref:Phosphoglycerate mutase family protein n=1 Tax=Teladorsagia circumcincta TaxID=45464 RepID=A0A2G9UM13_TELCI|nr:phosphoglycerate mutase family protein [Teladorsagia circumcincta]